MANVPEVIASGIIGAGNVGDNIVYGPSGVLVLIKAFTLRFEDPADNAQIKLNDKIVWREDSAVIDVFDATVQDAVNNSYGSVKNHVLIGIRTIIINKAGAAGAIEYYISGVLVTA